MGTFRRKLHFQSHLRVLYRLFCILGLIHFKFNYSTRRFEHSRVLRTVSTITNNFVRCVYGYMIVSQLLGMLIAYVHTKKVEYKFTSVGAQEDILNKCCGTKDYLSALIYVCNYFRTRGILLPTINKMVDIHHLIGRRTKAGLFVDASVMRVLFMKACITCCRLKLPVFSGIIVACLAFDFLWILGYAIPELTFASYIYSQLFLIGVYVQMNELLQAADPLMDRRELWKLHKELISLSHRIHCVKHRLDDIYKPVFLNTFVGAAFDINKVYLSLKVLLYYKYIRGVHHILNWMCIIGFPACISYTFDTYLIGVLSDNLLHAEDDFLNLLPTISSKRLLRSRDVESQLLQRHVYGLRSVVFGGLKVDQQFAFEYAINVVLYFAVTCLQFYAGKEVYGTSSNP